MDNGVLANWFVCPTSSVVLVGFPQMYGVECVDAFNLGKKLGQYSEKKIRLSSVGVE